MLKSVTITNYLNESVTYTFEGPTIEDSSGLLITEIKGLGPPKADVNMTELATADGAIFNSARLERRNIVLKALYTYADTIEEARLKTYKFFPIKKPVTVTVKTDNRIAEAVGYVESNEPEIFSENAEMQVSILCESPFFLSPNKDVTLFAGVDPLFYFPFSNDSLTEKLIIFGEIINKKTNTVYYSGDSEIGCYFEMHAIGLVENVTIYNLRTRERLKLDTNKLETLTGKKFVAGDTITVCTINGKKSITLLRDGVETNVLNILGKEIDWFQLSKGDNVFGFVAEYGEENIQFKITSQVAYEGV